MQRQIGSASFLFSQKAQYCDAITKGAYSGVMFKLEHCTNRQYARLCFQMDHFCNADATTTPVGSYQIDPWMFLYEAYFVLLPIMYFQCPACGHRCLGQRSLGCG